MLWYSLEVPHRGTSNEYAQHMFSWRNKKNIIWNYGFILSWCENGHIHFLAISFFRVISIHGFRVIPSFQSFLALEQDVSNIYNLIGNGLSQV